MYLFGLKIKAMGGYCNRCGEQIYHSDVKGYPYVCFDCDENVFAPETHRKDKNGKNVRRDI